MESVNAIRALDAVIQEWISVHQRAQSYGENIANTKEQQEKTLAELRKRSNSIYNKTKVNKFPNTNLLNVLVAKQQLSIEASMELLIQAMRDYGSVLSQMIIVHEDIRKKEQANDKELSSIEKLAGISLQYARNAAKECVNEYTKEYLKRKKLVEDLTIAKSITVSDFASRWMVSDIDHSIEENYLDRLRLVNLAMQWEANNIDVSV